MKILLAIFTIVFLSSCGSSKTDDTGDTLIWEIFSELAYCEGISVQKCMQVRDKGSSKYTLFYGEIEGFDYKEGTLYTIQLKKTQVLNPPADASSISYKLIKVLTKEVIRKVLEPSFRGYYRLTHLRGAEVQQKDLSFNINNQKRRVHGFSGCNSYTVPFISSSKNLQFEPVASTKKFCQDTQVLEQEFLSIFKEVSSYDIRNGKLKLYDKEGDELLQAKIGDPF